MKEITFTGEEKTLLDSLLKERLEYNTSYLQGKEDKKDRKKFETYYIKPLISALEKISKNEPSVYLKRERLICRSCINEHLEDYYKELDLENAFSWLKISDGQKRVVNKIDSCHDILVKFGFKTRKEEQLQYNPKFRYRNILTTVEKLKASDTIFLSVKNDPYKIAFVHDKKEFLTFELKNRILLYDIEFSSFINREPYAEYGKKYFSMVTTKEEAKKLLATCDKQDYPNGVLEFMEGVLS